MAIFEKTIIKEGVISGVGLHSGKPGKVTLKPALAGSGIRFYSAKQRGGPASGGKKWHYIRPVLDAADENTTHESLRCSSISDGKRSILTVEHLLGAIYGLGITNIEVVVEGPEIPALDGSAAPFVKRIREMGVHEQKRAAPAYKITEPIFCGEKGKAIAIYPSGLGATQWVAPTLPAGQAGVAPTLSVTYVMDYPHPFLSNQKVDFEITPEIFEKEIAPARTFITEEEEGEVRRRRLGLGGSEKNTLVIRRDGAHRRKLRFRDECARHKVLDIIGDLALLGFPVAGCVVGLRSGHALNRKLMRGIQKQKEREIT